MSRSAFNIFAQRYLSALLSEFGTVHLNEPVPRNPKLRVYKLPSRTNWGTEVIQTLTTENRQVLISPEVVGEADLVDVLFEPDAQKPSREILGLLGELLTVPCIIEPLRWLPTTHQLRTCMRHWLQWKVEASSMMMSMNEAPSDLKLQQTEEDIVDKTSLVIVPSITTKQLQGWGAQPSEASPGIYHSPPAFCTTFCVTSELPQTDSTLWLRLLGRGKTQQFALQELLDLKAEHPLRSVALQQLHQWYLLLSQGQLGKESNSLMHLLSQV